MCVLSSQCCKPLQSLVLHAKKNKKKTGYIAETKLIWTAVTLNGRDASGLFTNGKGIKKCMARQCTLKPFGGQKGDLSEPPPPLQLSLRAWCIYMSICLNNYDTTFCMYKNILQ